MAAVFDATVAIPWRPTPERIPTHDRVVKFWHDHGFDVIEADSDPAKPWLAGQARNNAVRAATTDIVIVMDADMIVHDIRQIDAAVIKAAQGFVVWPYTVYRAIPAACVDEDDLYGCEVLVESANEHPCGIVARRDVYWDLGGYDEGFTPGVWGWEDTAFAMVARTLAPHGRIHGLLYAFDHGGAHDMTDDNPNKPRACLYTYAEQDPRLMRALIGFNPARRSP